MNETNHETQIDILALEVERACRKMAEPFTHFVVCASHLRNALAAELRERLPK